MTEKIFAQNLKAARKAAGLTQRELAEKIGYSEKSVSKWESGNTVAPGAMLPEIAKVLGTDIDSLFALKGEAEFFLGIDGGGTKTEFLLADKNGCEIKRIILSAANPVDIGIDGCIDLLRRGIYDVCGGIRKTSVYAGIAGGGVGNNAEKIQKALKSMGFLSAGVGSDILTAYAAGLGSSDGISVIMGTGSVVYAKCKGESFRMGGYGYIFGDPGSGFDIGRDGIIASLKAEEGREKDTVLLKKIKKKYNSDVFSALPVFYRGGKREVASVAPLVFEAEAEGDSVASEILANSMKNLALIINAAAEKFNGETRAVLSGSVAGRFETIKKYLCPFTDEKINIELSAHTPVEGALMLAGAKIYE